MNIKFINDIVYWLISSGALGGVFIFAWKYLKPVMVAKQKHAKTVQEKELLGLIEDLADTAVTSLVSRADITGHDKFKAATQEVQGALTAKGLSATEDTIQSAVQSAYEKSDLTPTVNPDEKPQQGVVVSHE